MKFNLIPFDLRIATEARKTVLLNILNLVGRGLASNPKREYQVFLCIFQKNLAMATYGLKEMGKFLQT